jgi:hypothetical protein
MTNGKGILQPDKAGNFGYELVTLYKITDEQKYLDAAVRIASVLAERTRPGNNDESPLPFRVNPETGKTGILSSNSGDGKTVTKALYTANWTGSLMLFQEMQRFDAANADLYKKSFDTILSWMKEYPLKTNKWGPFFEDVSGWSNTQINAVTFAMFIMLNRDLFPDWEKDVKGIFDWTYLELGNKEYSQYGVTVMNEQTVYRVPGNSHSSRQASMELWYAKLSGDTTFRANAIRTLHCATYTVDWDGKNRYIRNDVWLTDGYGDYVRHYLRAMAALPELAPSHKNKLLLSSSVVRSIEYGAENIAYKTFDAEAMELLRLKTKPVKILAAGVALPRAEEPGGNSWTWTPMETGGVLRINHEHSNEILILLK